jgi:hypothetical protein
LGGVEQVEPRRTRPTVRRRPRRARTAPSRRSAAPASTCCRSSADANRTLGGAARLAIEDELAHARELIAEAPEVARPHVERQGDPVSRVLLPRTSHHVNCEFDRESAVVTILAVWGTPRGRGPKHGLPQTRFHRSLRTAPRRCRAPVSACGSKMPSCQESLTDLRPGLAPRLASSRRSCRARSSTTWERWSLLAFGSEPTAAGLYASGQPGIQQSCRTHEFGFAGSAALLCGDVAAGHRRKAAGPPAEVERGPGHHVVRNQTPTAG